MRSVDAKRGSMNGGSASPWKVRYWRPSRAGEKNHRANLELDIKSPKSGRDKRMVGPG